MLTFIAFLFALTLLVSVHEWGHYRMAVAFGVKVLRFSIGFGHPVFRWRKPNQRHDQDTEVTVGYLPLGGYVFMLDEANGPVMPQELGRAFNRQSLWARTLIVAAGPLANLLLAVCLFAVGAWWGQAEPSAVLSTPVPMSVADRAGLQGGERVVAAGLVDAQAPDNLPQTPVESYGELQEQVFQALTQTQDLILQIRSAGRGEEDLRTVRLPLAQLASPSDAPLSNPLSMLGIEGPRSAAVIGRLEPDSPAAKAGLRVADKVLQVDDHAVADAQFLRQRIRQSVEAGVAKPMVLTVERSGQVLSLTVQPMVWTQADQTIGRIGAVVGAAPATQWVSQSLWGGVVSGFEKVWTLTGLTFHSIADMLSGRAGLDQLGGPLMIADQAGRSAHTGWVAYLGFLGFLSVSLGLLNLLPLPMLDGGHLMYYLWELLTGKPVSSDWINLLQKAGLMLLVALMATAWVNDGIRLLR